MTHKTQPKTQTAPQRTRPRKITDSDLMEQSDMARAAIPTCNNAGNVDKRESVISLFNKGMDNYQIVVRLYRNDKDMYDNPINVDRDRVFQKSLLIVRDIIREYEHDKETGKC